MYLNEITDQLQSRSQIRSTLSILVKTSIWPCRHFEIYCFKVKLKSLLKKNCQICNFTYDKPIFYQKYLKMQNFIDFQNGDRVKSWSLPECSKCFLFATDSNRLLNRVRLCPDYLFRLFFSTNTTFKRICLCKRLSHQH